MRLIVKDYLLQLKEKDELDLLLCDVLFQMGYITENKPETGNRQYGVDIRAHNEHEILLCVVKQGNLTRRVWDADPNAVRQSLTEIHDCYLDLIKGPDRKKKLHIIVATNGMMDEAVRPNWEGYISRNTKWDEMDVEIEFWNIDKITDCVQKNLFDEHVFDIEMQGLLRRALYYIGESNYRKEYYEQIINKFLAQLKDSDSDRVCKKKLSGLYLASQMIAQYAADAAIFKIGIMVSEYLIIQYWKYISVNKKFEKAPYSEWLLKYLTVYEKWNQKYYETIRYCCEGKHRVPAYNPVEQKVLLYEMVSFLASYGYHLSFRCTHDDTAAQRCNHINQSIVQLINNYPQFLYAPYDKHIGTISILFRFWSRIGTTSNIYNLIDAQCICLEQHYRLYHKYPSPVDSFEDAVNIHLGLPTEEYVTSAFWGTMLEWLVILDRRETYDKLQPFLTEDIADVTKCVWFIKPDEESFLYDAYAMNSAGDGVAYEASPTYDAMKENVKFVMGQYSTDTFSFNMYSFDSVEIMACRYYGYIPLIKLN